MTMMLDFVSGQWSRRKKLIGAAAAAVATAALGFVVPQVLAAIKTKVAPPPALHAQVITDVARFRSSAPHVPEFVVPRPLAQIGHPPDASDIDPQFLGSWQCARLDPLCVGASARRRRRDGDPPSDQRRRNFPAATDLQQLRVRLVHCQAPLKVSSSPSWASGRHRRAVLLDRSRPEPAGSRLRGRQGRYEARTALPPRGSPESDSRSSRRLGGDDTPRLPVDTAPGLDGRKHGTGPRSSTTTASRSDDQR